jgi:hypothetical protein
VVGAASMSFKCRPFHRNNCTFPQLRSLVEEGGVGSEANMIPYDTPPIQPAELFTTAQPPWGCTTAECVSRPGLCNSPEVR